MAEEGDADEEHEEVDQFECEQPARSDEVPADVAGEEDARRADGDRARQQARLVAGAGVLEGDERALGLLFGPAAPEGDDHGAEPRHHEEERQEVNRAQDVD